MAARRILFVETSVGGVVGGSLTGILHLIARLDRRRFAPALALAEAKAIDADGLPVTVLPPLPAPSAVAGRARVVRAAIRARDLLAVTAPRSRAWAAVVRREAPALVYCANGLTANLDVVIAAAAAGIPILCHEKGFRRVGPAERLASRWVDVCVSMKREIAAHSRARGVRARRFVTVFDGIDCSRFAPGGGAD